MTEEISNQERFVLISELIDEIKERDAVIFELHESKKRECLISIKVN
tara:strand:+ start:8720 stop:8860 length:141 start_codon:yes stop_codon:yes gene_type:complete